MSWPTLGVWSHARRHERGAGLPRWANAAAVCAGAVNGARQGDAFGPHRNCAAGAKGHVHKQANTAHERHQLCARGSSRGFLQEVENEHRPWPAVRRLLARKWASEARIRAISRFSGAEFGRGADSEAPDAIRQIRSGLATSVPLPRSAPSLCASLAFVLVPMCRPCAGASCRSRAARRRQ